MGRKLSVSSTASTSTSSELASPVNNLKRKFEDPDVSDSSSDSSDPGNEEEPTSEVVLSHKQRRKQKQETKKAGTGPPSKKQKLEDGSASPSKESPLKRKNSVWVGNLSFKTQQENLREFFKSAGEVTRINMPTKAVTVKGMKPENRGFAYVDFATVEAKAAAIAMSEQPLIGRKLLIKDGDSFEGRPSAVAGPDVIKDPEVAHKTHTKTAQKILRSQKQAPAPTLFFGNLPFETTEVAIKELLNAHRLFSKDSKSTDAPEDEEKTNEDWVRKIRMGTFEDSGLCKGFAFVDFTSIDNATAALINPKNHRLNGRDLVVEYAGPDAVRRGASKSLLPPQKFKPKPLSAGYKKTRGRKLEADKDTSQEKTEFASSAISDAPPNPNKRREKKDRTEVSIAGERATYTSSTRLKGPKYRPKPGAALALAKRETAAILPSQGKKITFE